MMINDPSAGRSGQHPAAPTDAARPARWAWPLSRIGGVGLFIGAATVILLGVAAGGAFTFLRHDPGGLDAPASAAPSRAPVAQSTPPIAALGAGPQTASGTATTTTPAAMPAVVGAASDKARFASPAEESMPGGEYGKVIRLGEQVFMDTKRHAGKYVGNDLSCANCHLDAGRKPHSAPMWAAFIHYPAYRSKTGAVDTLASRIQGCFRFSMNGKAPPEDDAVMTALQTYFFWLAKGAPVGTEVAGAGYPKLGKPAEPASYERGQAVFDRNCALCHGADGLGQRAGDHQVFPPLWGPRSFNWGAGMHQLGNAAGFIKANMPLGRGGSLSDQEAWDVALFMNSHERPQDPRFTGSVAETRKRFHDSDDSMYGLKVGTRVLGTP